MRNKRSSALTKAARAAHREKQAFEAKKGEALKALRSLEQSCNRSKLVLMRKAKETSAIVARVGLSFYVEGEITENPLLEHDVESRMNEMASAMIEAIVEEVREAAKP